MVCVSCTLQMEGKSKEIFAKLHNDLNNKVDRSNDMPFDFTNISK